ncbi:MAG: hypothetical protein HC836_13655 [Richelia sp. RM2_1_2]|nr:hypothetical protein [Richelia sp. SM1_7_0]NJN12589.1 hypothetical protein [Richelia sp. RM1_1_1]NJO28423.1 hypothetical protein [Richelia sp. SL_2_1]NJO59311.1 hypothetical protein [Richelia sp. RM2_1_2]
MNQLLLDDILQQIKQEIEIDAQGRGKASIRATAKLAGVSSMEKLFCKKQRAVIKLFNNYVGFRPF